MYLASSVICLVVIAVVFGLRKFVFKPKKTYGTRKKLDAVVFSGPSGVGKGTIISKLRTEYPTNFALSISHTTRAPRAGEVDGRDYHFTTVAALEKMMDKGEFLECSMIHGNMYGTSKASLNAVCASGKVAIVEIDFQGVQKLKKQQGNLNFYYIFFKADLTELEERIRGRGKESEEKVMERLETAKKELAFVDANPDFYDKVLHNKVLKESYDTVVRMLKFYGAF